MMATAFAHAANNQPYTMGQRTTPSPPQSYYPGNASPQTPPSANQSPTSYHAHLHVRQLRPQKQPLYTPACLRPTESSRPKDIPGPRAPDTPPTSNHSSFDNGSIGLDLPATSNMSSQESEFNLIRQGLSRVASDTIDEEFGEVTGPPTVAHWKVRRFVHASWFVKCCVGLWLDASFAAFASSIERPSVIAMTVRESALYTPSLRSTQPVTQSHSSWSCDHMRARPGQSSNQPTNQDIYNTPYMLPYCTLMTKH